MAKKKKHGQTKQDTVTNEVADAVADAKHHPRSKFLYIPTTLAIIIAAIILVIVASAVSLRLMFTDRIYPGISVAQVNVTGLTKTQAVERVESQISSRLN